MYTKTYLSLSLFLTITQTRLIPTNVYKQTLDTQKKHAVAAWKRKPHRRGKKVKVSHTASEETAQHPVRHVHFMGHVLFTHTTAHSFTIHLQAQLHVHFMCHVLFTHTHASHSLAIHLQTQTTAVTWDMSILWIVSCPHTHNHLIQLLHFQACLLLQFNKEPKEKDD